MFLHFSLFEAVGSPPAKYFRIFTPTNRTTPHFPSAGSAGSMPQNAPHCDADQCKNSPLPSKQHTPNFKQQTTFSIYQYPSCYHPKTPPGRRFAQILKKTNGPHFGKPFAHKKLKSTRRGGRTLTTARSSDFESDASANSAIRASHIFASKN